MQVHPSRRSTNQTDACLGFARHAMAACLALAALFFVSPTSTLAAVAQATGPCAITQAKLLGDGGNQDWSAALDLIAYDTKDASGNRQLHTVKPDGSGDACLSCVGRPGGPRIDRHKAQPTWNGSGTWIVLQVENDWHPLVWWRNDFQAELIINGMATELYAVSPDGQRWVRLTSYAATYPAALGAMSAHFSADGKQLIWSKLIAPASSKSAWGTFRLMVADFVLGPDGTPSLQNPRDVTPAGDIFVEAHGLSPDGKSALFTTNSDPADPNNMEIWKVDLATMTPTQLTNSPYWDEHAAFSRSGNKVVYMAGELGVWFMSADLMIMNADGGNKQRLTSFNQTGQPGNTGELTMVMHPTWNGAGTRMAVTEQLANGYPGRRRLWVLNFAGVCG